MMRMATSLPRGPLAQNRMELGKTLTTHYEYDGNGQLTKTTYPRCLFTRTVYNALGNRAMPLMPSTTRPTMITTTTAGSSKPLTRTAPRNRLPTTQTTNVLTSTDRARRTTSYTYDVMGRLTNTVYPNQSTPSQSVYDALGQTIKVIDGLNHVPLRLR